MKKTDDETLLLFHYAELPAREMTALRERMTSDDELATRYAELAAMLDAVPEPDSERDEFYGRRTWAAIEDRLPFNGNSHHRTSWWRIAGMAAALGIVAVTAYHFGQTTATVTPVFVEQASPSDTRARVIKAGLQSHMESASRLFLELENSSSMPVVDVEAERNWAMTLLVANRLYRFAAEQAGQKRIAQVLYDMEPLLIELANSERTLTNEEFQSLRLRLESNDLVFKARTTSQSLQETESGGSI